ncbi:MAG: DNA repair protein RecN [Desulfobulbaceae bacterium]|uniref:DNA repair protein RecN n=1 Tax=Candidatus Desulfatifera sulfidica TaxID=2841691 RepID=A0A8J6NAB5_9BACT|nr:DNA repair protein RecN [Candidatus Desulfatifera sulfidica]
MLCELKIKNLALIESLHLVFDQAGPGAGELVVMTGETGAGKSILLRGLHLLMGGRASLDWIRSGSESCEVEALFELGAQHEEIRAALQEQGLDDDMNVIIRRQVLSRGGSRITINGVLVPARTVAGVMVQLMNVAGQHDHQQLLQPSNHLDMLDTVGELESLRDSYTVLYRAWQDKLAALVELQQQEQDKEERRELLTYQLEEIRRLAPEPGEDEQLQQERQRLKGADGLIRLGSEAHHLLSSSVQEKLVQVRRAVEQLAQLDPESRPLVAELIDYSYQAEDLSDRLRQYRDALEANPYRLEQVGERLQELQQLKRKYGDTLEAVIEFGLAAEEELQRIETMDQELQALDAQAMQLQKEVMALATVLSGQRRETGRMLEQGMTAELSSLAFHQARFQVLFQESNCSVESLGPHGCDRLEFFFSANAGEPLRPLAKVASGGELSRLMLAMKCLLARRDRVNTVIFDEVDAGIGGEAAEAVARKIRELASHHQVFCITHLPQIAARGTLHFLVLKQQEGDRTVSTVTRLEPRERTLELARMLAGESADEQTRVWAEALLVKGGEDVCLR